MEKAIFTLQSPNRMHEFLVKYSSWSVLLRKVAWLLQFKSYLKKDKDNSSSKYLTKDDLQKATTAVVRLVQNEAYPKKGKKVKHSSRIVKLWPMLDNGVMQVGGRICQAAIAFGAKFPMIMPAEHHVTQLIIAAFHQRLAHAGQNHILTSLREQFWIPRGRSAVRKVVRPCLKCKKQRAATWSSVSHYSLSTMLHSQWCRLFWTVKREKRESHGQEMGCHIHLFEF